MLAPMFLGISCDTYPTRKSWNNGRKPKFISLAKRKKGYVSHNQYGSLVVVSQIIKVKNLPLFDFDYIINFETMKERKKKIRKTRQLKEKTRSLLKNQLKKADFLFILEYG